MRKQGGYSALVPGVWTEAGLVNSSESDGLNPVTTCQVGSFWKVGTLALLRRGG